MRWELALEEMLNGNTSGQQLHGHEDCDLGTWIYGTGLKKYGKLSSVWRLKTVHKQFHQVADQTARTCATMSPQQIQARKEQVRALSGEILFLLTALELDVIEAVVETSRSRKLPSFMARLLMPKPRPINMITVQSSGKGQEQRHQLNVTGARLAHLQWIRDLQSSFRGHHKTIRIQPSDECSLGIWLHGTAMKELGAIPALQELDRVHKRFHNMATLVLQSLRVHKFSKADEAYEEALELSGEIIRILTQLQLEVLGSDYVSAQNSTL